jgi:type I restriction enzyme S subunit
MKVSKGFKQTEIGEIPEDWEVISIGEIFRFYPTSNFSKSQMSLEGDVGCLHYGLIHSVRTTSFDVEQGIRYYVSSNKGKYEKLENGDVIMVDASEDLEGLNKSVEVNGVSGKAYIAGLHTFHLRDEKSLMASFFRGAMLNSNTVKSQMLRLAVGMKVFGVSKNQLKTVLIPLPPLKEQQAIAEVLSDMDRMISQTEALIEKKKAIKQGMMQELLKPKKASINANRKFKQTELGEIPEDWEVDLIKNHVNIKTGNKNTQDKVSDGFYPFFVRSQEIERINTFSYDCEAVLTAGDGVGVGKVMHYVNGKFDCHQRVYCLSNFSSKLNGYYFFLFFSSHFQDRVFKMTAKSSVDSIRMEMIAEMPIPLPPIKEQQAIADSLSVIDSNISTLVSKLQKLKLQKYGVMQVLLSGRVRLCKQSNTVEKAKNQIQKMG